MTTITNKTTRTNTGKRTRSNAKSKVPVTARHAKPRDPSVRLYIDAALADNTRRGYQSDLKQFAAWGGVIPATAESVATYVAQNALLLSSATLSRRVVAIGHAHTARGLPSPAHSEMVKATLRGIRRKRGHRPRQVAALQKNDVVRVVKGLRGMRGLRDKAMLLFGFAGAFRRSELVALDVEDIEFGEQGAMVRLRRSKTDQEGRGRVIAIPFVRGRNCPCCALQSWLAAAEIETGALFRRVNRFEQVLPDRLSSQSVALVIKERVAAVGLNPELYSGHSLRAGFATSAAISGASSSSIRAQTGHSSDAMLAKYIRSTQLFVDNPLGRIW
jgi:integrase